MVTPLSQMATAGQQPPAGADTQAALAGMAPQPTMPGQSVNPIEQSYFDRLSQDYQGLAREYAALPSTDGGRILNTDDAREMSPEYRADRTKSADVHEPSSAFVKQMYAEKLMQPTPAGRDNTVLFTAGGTGAGKTTSLQAAAQQSKGIQNAEMVYDTNMNTFESADKKVKQALAAGRKVGIVYTYRDPVEALKNGNLSRASRMEAEMGTGRTVPIDEHFRTHAGVREVMERLQAKYGSDHRFHLMTVDNSRGPGNAKVVSGLDKLPKFDHTVVRRELDNALEEAYRTGKISQAIYEGTRGKPR